MLFSINIVFCCISDIFCEVHDETFLPLRKNSVGISQWRLQWRSLCDHFFDDHDFHDDGDLGDDLNDHINDNGIRWLWIFMIISSTWILWEFLYDASNGDAFVITPPVFLWSYFHDDGDGDLGDNRVYDNDNGDSEYSWSSSAWILSEFPNYALDGDIHAKNVWCCGEGYFGQKKLRKKCVNRDIM